MNLRQSQGRAAKGLYRGGGGWGNRESEGVQYGRDSVVLYRKDRSEQDPWNHPQVRVQEDRGKKERRQVKDLIYSYWRGQGLGVIGRECDYKMDRGPRKGIGAMVRKICVAWESVGEKISPPGSRYPLMSQFLRRKI